MFFLHELEQIITLHPSFFGPRVKDYLSQKLYEDVEGTCNGSFYIICVVDMSDIPDGKVISGSGVAEYTIRYRAVVWKPFRGETVDAIVTSMNRFGFFCEAGPLKIFVSSHLLPGTYEYQPDTNPPQYADHENKEYVNVGGHVRVKIMGTRPDQGDIYAIASMKEDWFGPFPEGTD